MAAREAAAAAAAHMPLVRAPKTCESLDLLDGYYQIGINEEDQQKAAFTTPFGHYEFKVLPMGISNAPSTFQAVMNNLFS